jgi:hypothetical protein
MVSLQTQEIKAAPAPRLPAAFPIRHSPLCSNVKPMSDPARLHWCVAVGK